jgi:hypothetical protein
VTPTPETFLTLDQNFFNPVTQPSGLGMDVRVDTPGRVQVMVFNIAGEQVAKIWDQNEPVGNFRVYWDGKNLKGEIVGNAVYFVVIQSPDGHRVRQAIVLKWF